MLFTRPHVHCVVQLKAHIMTKDLYVAVIHSWLTADGTLDTPSTCGDDIGVEMRAMCTRHEGHSCST